jgi:hypothetical protein
MPATLPSNQNIEQQALEALNYLSEDDKTKVLKYIESLIFLQTSQNDETSST